MKQTSKISKLRLQLAAAALLGGMALAPAVLSQAANAGPYHMDSLPDGTVTGPVAPDAAGG
jgi:hypothetical protein